MNEKIIYKCLIFVKSKYPERVSKLNINKQGFTDEDIDHCVKLNFLDALAPQQYLQSGILCILTRDGHKFCLDYETKIEENKERKLEFNLLLRIASCSLRISILALLFAIISFLILNK